MSNRMGRADKAIKQHLHKGINQHTVKVRRKFKRLAVVKKYVCKKCGRRQKEYASPTCKKCK